MVTVETPLLGCPDKRNEGIWVAECDVAWLFLCAIRGAVLPLLPTADMATAPVPPPPMKTTAAVVAGGAAFPPIHRRPPLHRHLLVHTEGSCAARVPPLAPLGAADYSRTHRRAPPSTLAQPLAHAHAPAACRRIGTESLRTHRSTRRSRVPQLYSTALFLFGISAPLWPAVFLFLFAAHFATPARTHARTRMTDDGRSDVRSAGVADWDTSGGREHGAYAHRQAPPPFLRPLSPRPCKAAAAKGPAFCFLNSERLFFYFTATLR